MRASVELSIIFRNWLLLLTPVTSSKRWGSTNHLKEIKWILSRCSADWCRPPQFLMWENELPTSCVCAQEHCVVQNSDDRWHWPVLFCCFIKCTVTWLIYWAATFLLLGRFSTIPGFPHVWITARTVLHWTPKALETSLWPFQTDDLTIFAPQLVL